LFDAISEDAQCQSLSRRYSLFFRSSVRHHTGHVHNLGDPTSVLFTLCFHFVDDVRHTGILACMLPLLRRQSLARLPQHPPPHLKLFNRTKHPILYLETHRASQSHPDRCRSLRSGFILDSILIGPRHALVRPGCP